jgi:FO synthase
VSYSRKVFIPLTELCRDVCHYCTFAKTPERLDDPYLSPESVLAIARAGQAAGCKEALFTLGDQPERRYPVARRALESYGVSTTLELLERMARLVLDETTLLPHLNAGVMTHADLDRLRPVSVSMGLMLETASERLSARGGPHFGSPDKWPAARLMTCMRGRTCGPVHEWTADRYRGDAPQGSALLALRDRTTVRAPAGLILQNSALSRIPPWRRPTRHR